jgi:predicted nucleic acid-binding protein
MAGVTYLLDTNAVSDLLKRHPIVHTRLQAGFRNSDTVCICQPVYYEVLRGLLRGGATTKLAMLRRDFLPFFRWTPLTDDDWMQAATTGLQP